MKQIFRLLPPLRFYKSFSAFGAVRKMSREPGDVEGIRAPPVRRWIDGPVFLAKDAYP